MRSVVLLSVLALLLGLGRPVAAAEPSTATSSVDHILLWGRDIDQSTAIMAVKLGFQVRPGRNPGGVANRYIRFADRSFIELLGITRKDPEFDPGMQADQAALKGGPGARTFGLSSTTLDQVRTLLQQRGLAPTPIFSASPTDPDGQGPGKPPRWRLFAFEHQPLSSNLFFIDYATGNTSPTYLADDKVIREHPNGAKELSAVWLLSADTEADRKQFEHMGYAGAKPVRIAQVSAHGYVVPVGKKHVFLLQPDGPGIAADALQRGGPQVLAVSIGVTDVDRAKRWAERGYEQELPAYCGSLGRAFLAPAQDDLGLLVEFHALSTSAACPAKGG
ncbi:MAG TPA: VOC family protein [Luteibacter sp.]|nr:VOC family protein [Luteibacter sp.]